MSVNGHGGWFWVTRLRLWWVMREGKRSAIGQGDLEPELVWLVEEAMADRADSAWHSRAKMALAVHRARLPKGSARGCPNSDYYRAILEQIAAAPDFVAAEALRALAQRATEPFQVEHQSAGGMREPQ